MCSACSGNYEDPDATAVKDVSVVSHGSIVLFHLLSPAAESFVEEFVTSPETMFFGNALVVEPRYASDLAQGMVEHGLVL